MRVNIEQKYDDNITDMESIIETLELTKTQGDNLKSSIESMQWKGAHRDHALSLLDIVLQYHSSLINISKDIKSGLTEFKTEYENLESTEVYNAVKNLGNL